MEGSDLFWSTVKSPSPEHILYLTIFTALYKSSNSRVLLLPDLTQNSAMWNKPYPYVTKNNSNQLELLTWQLSNTVISVRENKNLAKNVKGRPGEVDNHKRLWKALRYFWEPRRLCACSALCLCPGDKWERTVPKSLTSGGTWGPIQSESES